MGCGPSSLLPLFILSLLLPLQPLPPSPLPVLLLPASIGVPAPAAPVLDAPSSPRAVAVAPLLDTPDVDSHFSPGRPHSRRPLLSPTSQWAIPPLAQTSHLPPSPSPVSTSPSPISRIPPRISHSPAAFKILRTAVSGSISRSSSRPVPRRYVLFSFLLSAPFSLLIFLLRISGVSWGYHSAILRILRRVAQPRSPPSHSLSFQFPLYSAQFLVSLRPPLIL